MILKAKAINAEKTKWVFGYPVKKGNSYYMYCVDGTTPAIIEKTISYSIEACDRNSNPLFITTIINRRYGLG